MRSYLLKLRAEVEVMQQLGVSLNAVNLHGVYEDDTNVHMVMELCEGGALLERVESGLYSEAYISRLVRSILRFIAQCHAKVRRGRGRAARLRCSARRRSRVRAHELAASTVALTLILVSLNF